jgi:asparagine synthetase B (glutamine-hydrolysing)
MCGVIGYVPLLKDPDQSNAFFRLFYESRIRGVHAFGIYQDVEPFTSFDFDSVEAEFDPTRPAIAHCRYSTSGDWHSLKNAQPLMARQGGTALVFNGVIHMGTREEFNRDFNVNCTGDNDGEVFLRKLDQGIQAETFLDLLEGSFAGCWIDKHSNLLYARNTRRPLWRRRQYGALWVASTKDIFLRAGFSEPEEVPPGVVFCE